MTTDKSVTAPPMPGFVCWCFMADAVRDAGGEILAANPDWAPTTAEEALDCFRDGAEWVLAGMAVCEFLSGLAALANACRVCCGSGSYPGCYSCIHCHGTGKRVAP